METVMANLFVYLGRAGAVITVLILMFSIAVIVRAVLRTK